MQPQRCASAFFVPIAIVSSVGSVLVRKRRYQTNALGLMALCLRTAVLGPPQNRRWTGIAAPCT